MTTPDPSVALKLLEELRAEKFADVPAELLSTIHRLEHEQQFERERGVIQARLRDLVSESISEEDE